MATWITHLMIADGILAHCPQLDRRGFCVGNIAPDCNQENEDWSAFIPSREVTHWMTGERKALSDCDAFCKQYIWPRRDGSVSREEYSFMVGYYAHLLTDAAFQLFVRDGERVSAVWRRLHENPVWKEQAQDREETWDEVKRMVPRSTRMHEIESMEAEYLWDNPGSGYLTEILPLQSFPDYLDYMPQGCYVRKIGVMGTHPKPDEALLHPVSISREELERFRVDTIRLVLEELHKKQLLDVPALKE